MGIIISFIKKELTQTLRDPRMRFVLFGAPILQLVIFGYVATTDIKNVALLVKDFDRSQTSRELVASFVSSGYFIKLNTNNLFDAEKALRTNKAKAALVFPPDFSKKIARNEPAAIQVLIDATDGNAAALIKGYVEQIINDYALKMVRRRQLTSAAGNLVIQPEIRILYNPQLKSANYMVPGLICMILLLLTSILTAVAITREKELGTLEQIIVSPLKRWEFIVGKTIPFVLVGFVDILLILAAAKILFDIPIRGSIFLLLVAAIIFLFTSLGLGLLAATVSRSQTQAMLTVMPVMMPAFLLSGLFFPVASIPSQIRWIAYLNPITYFLIVVRGILLKGSGLVQLYREFTVLVIFGIGFLAVSSLLFRKRIE